MIKGLENYKIYQPALEVILHNMTSNMAFLEELLEFLYKYALEFDPQF
jgi:hypothetical protein